eukprot:328819_1
MATGDAQSHCILEYNTNPNEIQYETYDNLVLLEWCDELHSKFDMKIPCPALIDHSLAEHMINLYLCDGRTSTSDESSEETHNDNLLHFMFLYATNATSATSMDVFINT